MLTSRTAWFPLRSNIAYFETTGPSLDIEARVKQMAMLSDELLFEPGMLDVTISDQGSWDMHIPLSQLSEEDIRQRRQAVTVGEPVGFFIGPESVPGVPAPPKRCSRSSEASSRAPSSLNTTCWRGRAAWTASLGCNSGSRTPSAKPSRRRSRAISSAGPSSRKGRCPRFRRTAGWTTTCGRGSTSTSVAVLP